MILLYIKEFVAITDYLVSRDMGIVRGGSLFVDKQVIVSMMERNMHDSTINKLRLWKGLNWIDTDHGRFTKRLVDSQTKERVQKVKIYLKAYEILKEKTAEPAKK